MTLGISGAAASTRHHWLLVAGTAAWCHIFQRLVLTNNRAAIPGGCGWAIGISKVIDPSAFATLFADWCGTPRTLANPVSYTHLTLPTKA